MIASALVSSYGKQVDNSDTNQGPPNLILDEPYTLDWMAGSSGDTSFRGKARSWIVDKPGRSRALTANRTLAVVEPAGERVANALTSHQGRNSGEDTFVCGALSAAHGGPDDNSGQAGHIIAFTERTRAEGRTFEAQDDLAYALTNPGRGGRTHSRQIAGGVGVRRLTPVECERLQGFPDNWTAGQSDSARYRQLGNAVAVPVAVWIGKRIMEATCQPPQPPS